MSEIEGWPYSKEAMEWVQMNRDEWKALAEERGEENRRLRRLLSEHHAVGALEGVLVGDHCQICARMKYQ